MKKLFQMMVMTVAVTCMVSAVSAQDGERSPSDIAPPAVEAPAQEGEACCQKRQPKRMRLLKGGSFRLLQIKRCGGC